MIDKKIKSLTFAALDRLRGVPKPPVTIEEEFPLPAWYRSVREVPLGKLGVEDLCKATRQRIHLKEIVPLALEFLASEPLAGEMYDGELLVSLKSVALDYWLEHTVEKQYLKSIIATILALDSVDPDIRKDAEELLRKAIGNQ